MIISASRRTDIPAFYFEWFLKRLEDGYVCVRNPFNSHQVSRVSLKREAVDCIVFWTKNPTPMLERLDRMEGWPFYVQYTITGYGRDVEPWLPDKPGHLVPAFVELSRRLGKERVIWRYDPILVSGRYTRDYHLKAFTCIAGELKGYTDKVVISFLDLYGKIKKRMEPLEAEAMSEPDMREIAGRMAAAADAHGLKIETCAEHIDLSDLGIGRGACIDRTLAEQISGRAIDVGRDRNQRPECGCAASVDIGTYDTCPCGCRYCYANGGGGKTERLMRSYDPASPLLCGEITGLDRITDRR